MFCDANPASNKISPPLSQHTKASCAVSKHFFSIATHRRLWSLQDAPKYHAVQLLGSE